MRFGVPMQWKEQKNHFDECYFCCVNLRGVNVKKMIYPDLESARRPLPHSEEVPVPTYCSTSESSQENNKVSSDSDLEGIESTEPKHLVWSKHRKVKSRNFRWSTDKNINKRY